MCQRGPNIDHDWGTTLKSSKQIYWIRPSTKKIKSPLKSKEISSFNKTLKSFKMFDFPSNKMSWHNVIEYLTYVDISKS